MNITIIVQSRATSVMGLIFETKTLSYYSFPFDFVRMALESIPAMKGIPR